MSASGTPCESSSTVSRSGHLVALMRLRRSSSAASGNATRSSRMAVTSVEDIDCSWGVGPVGRASSDPSAIAPGNVLVDPLVSTRWLLRLRRGY